MTHQKPEILNTDIIAQSRLFKVESVALRFSNGVERTYERMKGGGHGAVMMVPVDADNNLILIREYAVGTERYELGFPKGAIDKGETSRIAANRELMEEVGVGAKTLTFLKEINLAPSYFLLICRSIWHRTYILNLVKAMNLNRLKLSNGRSRGRMNSLIMMKLQNLVLFVHYYLP